MPLLVLLAALACVASSVTAVSLSANIASDGSYSVLVGGQLWIAR